MNGNIDIFLVLILESYKKFDEDSLFGYINMLNRFIFITNKEYQIMIYSYTDFMISNKIV